MTLADSAATFDHVGFITQSLEDSIAFWERVMGFRAEPIGTRYAPWIGQFMGVAGADVRLVHLYGLGTHIEFIEFRTPEGEPIRPGANQPGASHICLRVPDVEAIRKAVLGKGGTLQGEVVVITEGVAKGLRGLYMRDPNGIMIELVEQP